MTTVILKHTNKTVNQCIRFNIERNQTGWSKALPLIRFQIMNSVNKFIRVGFSPFQLRFGRSPSLDPTWTGLGQLLPILEDPDAACVCRVQIWPNSALILFGSGFKPNLGRSCRNTSGCYTSAQLFAEYHEVGMSYQ